MLKDENEGVIYLDKESDLAGLPQGVRDGMAQGAEGRGQKGKWAIANTRSSIEPFLTYADNRALREKAWRMFVNRGDNGGATDNNATIAQILQLRAERAQAARLPDARALAPREHDGEDARARHGADGSRVDAGRRARARGSRRHAEDRRRRKAGIKIEPWDYRYYAEKVRKAKYDLDETQVTPYMQLENLREGMFHMAKELFGFHFKPVDASKVPVYHPDVRVWEVTDPKGELVGLWYFDPYARKGKRSGAWMNAYRTQERFDGDVKTIVSNNSNFVKGKPGEPVLISWEDATHAVPRIRPCAARLELERELSVGGGHRRRARLRRVPVAAARALAVDAGDPQPLRAALPDRQADPARTGGQDRSGREVQPGLQDGRIPVERAGRHEAAPRGRPEDRRRTSSSARRSPRMGMPSEIVMRHRTPQFNHVFSGDGYSAGYYSYLWSDTLTADAWEAFTEAGGPWDKAVAKRLRDNVFCGRQHDRPGRSRYRQFRGRDPGIAALMRKRGFPVPPPAAPPRRQVGARSRGQGSSGELSPTIPLSVHSRPGCAWSRMNAYSSATSCRCSNRPDLPPWPASMLTRITSSRSSVLRRRSFATHFAGS